ncbi:nitric oxide reductase transcriptional regulator NorR [Pseudomonas ficuserectae]|uniref:Anaerobic nitric oxide reductase transcription regulator n=2 Tax=Pseudomonas amygdali pv. lachrymans TaxID=53707 RepID=A0AB37R5W0_PSEAV|nr:nitric oxide reductase transcriptional regulator NorR [Pseudomonas amygdali]ARA81237.1 nitric oxide reductase transcription regulator [Pseudomonas amygdali pv. lachrymans]AXH56720.1 nitric oxide reductase transcriptional regulator NorR [Pseudomonas amygdali pv. lachrymans str. M301315]KKY58348.1 transcriptional regulator [Pseudomonas amygdali pv. lachrymans]KPB97482.1 Anaerobic nitric oxide reductase transcription regulator [Pseudomonas amygdali pv. lachrymans]KPC18551.1 Anaerobic nitric ox
MTHPLLRELIPLVSDLSRELPDEERYRRLLCSLRHWLPCDATALLRLEGDVLIPLAVDGLSPDALGRRFRVSEHPRFEALLASDGPLRFAADCDLPDPYDGLVDGHGALEVHDCLGCVLSVQGRPWGLITLDSLDPSSFGSVDLDNLQAFASLAAATVMAGERINQLARGFEDQRQLAEVYKRAAGGRAPRELIGQSAVHQRMQQEIELVGNSPLTVLVTGETGVGKELVAESIHLHSPRAHKPLISLNCAALPEMLVESELFGHVKGAFSGAVNGRSGRFELADGGTLFLDEVGELPLSVQSKLLRVLQSGQLQRVGADQEHHVDVRIIAATNRDLAEEVRSGRFRADLYHRLSVYPLLVPALRERGRDVLLLAGYFLEENRVRMGLRGLRLSAEAQRLLLAHPWPGNVRELEHLISRAVLKALSAHPQKPRILTVEGAALGLDGSASATPLPTAEKALSAAVQGAGLKASVDAFQRSLIVDCLERHQGRWAEVARDLAVDRANLNRLAKRLGIR